MCIVVPTPASSLSNSDMISEVNLESMCAIIPDCNVIIIIMHDMKFNFVPEANYLVIKIATRSSSDKTVFGLYIAFVRGTEYRYVRTRDEGSHVVAV